MHDGAVAHPQAVLDPTRRRRRFGAALTAAVVVGTALAAAGIATFGYLVIGALSCDREFSTLSTALPEDSAVRELRSRFPDHENANTGCDEDDNTASADVEFNTGLDREGAVAAGARALTSNGWVEVDPESSCYTKQIRSHEVFAQFPPPDGYEEPGTNLIISLTTGQCWADW